MKWMEEHWPWMMGVLISAAGWFISIGKFANRISNLEQRMDKVDTKNETQDDRLQKLAIASERQTAYLENIKQTLDEIKHKLP